MKILFVQPDACLYGTSRSLLAMIEGLCRKGHNCSILLPQTGPLVNELSARDIQYEVIHWKSWTSSEQQWFPRRIASGTKRFYLNKQLLDEAAKICAKMQPDLIHTNSSKTPIGAMIADRMGVPHTWHFREFLGGCYSIGHVFSLGRRLSEAYICRKSKGIVLISRALERQFVGVAGKVPVHVVYNGVMSLADMKVCATTPMPNTDVLTLSLVGRFDEWKHPVVALEAIRLLKQKGAAVRLLVAGGGEDADVEKVTRFVRQHGLADAVELCGYVNDIGSVFKRCHAMLICSTGDAFGRVTAEAMAYGRSVIGADACATTELINHGHDGLLFKACDPVDLAEKINYLVQRPDLVQVMGTNAAMKAQREFTTEKYADSMIKIFLETLR